MKKILGLSIALILALSGYSAYQAAPQENNAAPQEYNAFGGANITNATTLIGSASNLVSLPESGVYANATTTDPDPSGDDRVLDGGFTLIQTVPTGGQNKIRLNFMFKADTSTSTVFVRQQVSDDETNFFRMHASSTEPFTGYNASSTPLQMSWAGASFDPGTVTTTLSLLFDTYGAKYSRFIIWSDDVQTDPTDGVQAFIQAVNVEPIR